MLSFVVNSWNRCFMSSIHQETSVCLNTDCPREFCQGTSAIFCSREQDTFSYLNPVSSWNLCLLCCCCFLMAAHLPWGQWDEEIAPNLQERLVLVIQWMFKVSAVVKTSSSNAFSTALFIILHKTYLADPESTASGLPNSEIQSAAFKYPCSLPIWQVSFSTCTISH